MLQSEILSLLQSWLANQQIPQFFLLKVQMFVQIDGLVILRRCWKKELMAMMDIIIIVIMITTIIMIMINMIITTSMIIIM